MGINGVGNGNNINWSVLLNNVAVTQNVNGAQGPQGKQNLTLSDADKQVLLGLLNAPQLDAPKGQEGNPAEKLESLINKLQDGKTFQFTEDQTKVFINTLTTLLQTVNALMPNNGSSGTAGAAGGAGGSFSDRSR